MLLKSHQAKKTVQPSHLLRGQGIGLPSSSSLNRTMKSPISSTHFGSVSRSFTSSRLPSFSSSSNSLFLSKTSLYQPSQSFSKSTNEKTSSFSLFNFGGFFAKGYGWEHFPSPKKQKSSNKGGESKEEENSEKKEEPKTETKTSKTTKSSSNKDPEKPPSDSSNSLMLWLALGALGFSVYMLMPSETGTLEWNEFCNKYLAQGLVKKVIIRDGNPNTATIILKDNSSHLMIIGSPDAFERKLEEAQNLLGVSSSEFVIVSHRQQHMQELLYAGISIAATGALLYFMFTFSQSARGMGKGGNGLFSIAKSNAKLFNKQDKIITRFKDVAGLPEAKQEIMEFVDFLKNPKKYERLGAKIPKGAILVGPPGTGKTLLAKATAGEAGVPFYSTSGSDFMEMFVGVGPARVRDLFKQARDSAPCIVFIDEIDAIGRARNKSAFSSGHDERENTLNQILVEMDGFSSNTGVIVLAGTNRPDVLDKALLRPGRFDRQIAIDKPDILSREEIFAVHLKPLKLEKPLEEYVKPLAQLTPGFSGADIANACNEAALIAARNRAEFVTMQHMESALDRIIGGLEKKNKVISPEEKKTVAYHEAGHTVAGWFLQHADPVLKVSIIPRGSSLGFSQVLPDEKYLFTREQLADRMAMALGGRVAEELTFGKVTTGAQDDLDRVTRLAYAQVKVYGMNPKVGPLSFQQDRNTLRLFSDATAQLIDEEARQLIKQAHDRTIALLIEKKELLERVAGSLLTKEVLNSEDLKAILGEKVKPEEMKPNI